MSMRRFSNTGLKKPKQHWWNKFFHQKKVVTHIDYVLLGLFIFVILFGLVMLSSASSVESFRRFDSTYYFFWRQITHGILPGAILFFVLSKIHFEFWQKYSLHFFIIAVLLLLIVFIPGLGVSYGRAQSWIIIGGFSLQPTEIVKLLMTLALAGWFSQRDKEKNRDLWNGLLPFTVLFGAIALPIILQPDIGTLMVIVAIAAAIYFVAGAHWKHVIALTVAGIAGLAILLVNAPYRAARLMTFLRPEVDPQGIGYHINQAFLAIGSGGIFGLGFGQSRQKFAYLPEVMGDSIFAIIAEELGFIFATILIIVFIAIVVRGLRIAQNAPSTYARYVAVGIVAWFGMQAFFNIGAMVGLMPLTGIPLPFVSYGGTALMSAMAGAGILLNISKHVKT